MLVVFDSDGTLYDPAAAHAAFINRRRDYIIRRRECSPEEADAFMAARREEHRSSAIVLARAFDTLPEEVVEETYLKIDLDQCVPRHDTALRESLGAIPHPKVVFTNSPSEFAWKVLKHLGIDTFFHGVFGEREFQYRLKPDPDAFSVVTRAYPNERHFVLVDDMLSNLDTARSLGWLTIWAPRPGAARPQFPGGHLVPSAFREVPELLQRTM